MEVIPSTLTLGERLLNEILKEDKVSRAWLYAKGVKDIKAFEQELAKLGYKLQVTCLSGEWRLVSLDTVIEPIISLTTTNNK